MVPPFTSKTTRSAPPYHPKAADVESAWWDDTWTDGGLVESIRLCRSLEAFGFIVVRQLLDAADVARARSVVLRHLSHFGSRMALGKAQPNAAVAVPDLAFLFAHQRIVGLYNAILGNGNVVFTGHADIHMNMLSGWHKDSGEEFGGYFRGDYFNANDCRVYKTAVYLQDSDDNTGLTLRAGSHRNPVLGIGREVKVDTRAGDVVIFDVRLDHTGQRPDLVEKAIKAFNVVVGGHDRMKEDLRIASAAKAAYWRALGRKDRLSVFFTFGYPNSYTSDFSFRNAVRQNKQSRMQGTELPASLNGRLDKLGVAVCEAGTRETWPAKELV